MGERAPRLSDLNDDEDLDDIDEDLDEDDEDGDEDLDDDDVDKETQDFYQNFAGGAA